MSPSQGEGPARAHLVRGDDPALVAQRAHALVASLVGGRDPALVVEEHVVADTFDVGAVVDACATPPFLVDLRVVVVRDAGRLGAHDAQRLAAAVPHLAPAVHLVVVAGGGQLLASLAKALGAGGEVVDAGAGKGRDRGRWVAEQVAASPVRLDAAAMRLLEDHLGDDLGRLAGILESLAAGYGEGAAVGADEVEPFLGEAGGVPPWELTDAIDRGDVAASLRALHRMLSAGGRSAPALVGVLHAHVSNLLRLDDADVVTPQDAAARLGTKSEFVAKKALERARRLGGERIAQMVTLVADADLDVKGKSALAPELVLEILVARLARHSRSRPSGRSAARGPGRTAAGGRR